VSCPFPVRGGRVFGTDQIVATDGIRDDLVVVRVAGDFWGVSSSIFSF